MYVKHKRKSDLFCYGVKLTYISTESGNPYLYTLPDKVWRHSTPWNQLLGQNDEATREAPPALQEEVLSCCRQMNSPGPCTARPARSRSTSPHPASSAALCGCIWRWPAPAAAGGSDPGTEDRRTPCSPAGPPAEPPSGLVQFADLRGKMEKESQAVDGSHVRTHPPKSTKSIWVLFSNNKVQTEI